jgi:hypothetical protein
VCRRTLTYDMVLHNLEEKGISIRVASPKLVMEEAPEAYKDVTAVVDTCTWRNLPPLAPSAPQPTTCCVCAVVHWLQVTKLASPRKL